MTRNGETDLNYDGRDRESLEHFERAVRLQRGFGGDLHDLGRYESHRALALMDLERWDDAIDAINAGARWIDFEAQPRIDVLPLTRPARL